MNAILRLELGVKAARTKTCGSVGTCLFYNMDVCSLLSGEHGSGKACNTGTDNDDIAIDSLIDFAIGNWIGRNFPRFCIGSNLDRFRSLHVFARGFLASLTAT